MKSDPIVEETRKARKEIEDECGNDPDAIYRLAMEIQKEYAGRVVSRGPVPARDRIRTVIVDTEKGIAMKNVSASELMGLSVPERIVLVEDLWDSIAAVPEAVALTEGQKKELDRRLEEYHKDPHAGAPWREVKKRICRDS